MQSKRVWARVLGVERGVIIERVDAEIDTDDIVVRCRVRRGRAGRCGECGRRCPGYDGTSDLSGVGRLVPTVSSPVLGLDAERVTPSLLLLRATRRAGLRGLHRP